MTPFLLAVALAAGAEGQALPAQVEGKWLIAYHEEGGRRETSWEQRVATVKGNTLSYSNESDVRTLHLTFGPRQTLKASITTTPKESSQDSKQSKEKDTRSMTGVCIAGQDYLCISLDGGDESGKGAKDRKRSSGLYILIMRRQR
jgi:hypothetical protein